MAHDIRSIGRGFLSTANQLAALAAACALIAFYAAPALFGRYDSAARQVQLDLDGSAALDVAFLIAVLLVLVNTLWLLYGRRPKPPLPFLISEAPGGPVKVARDAVEAGLRTAGESLECVSRLRVWIEQGKLKRIVVRALFQAPEGVSNLQASRQLRSALSERFHEMVRLTDGARAEFDVEFTGFSGKLGRRPESAVPAEEEEESSPFTGPKWPIDDDPFGGSSGGR